MDIVSRLNDPSLSARLDAAREIARTFSAPEKTPYVNNHIHTAYSFSPYSPAMAVYMAWKSGLMTAGLMDHDAIAGAEEFLEAGGIFGLGTTVGIECRVRAPGTLLWGRRTNNPDQTTATYMSLHGVPHTQFAAIEKRFAPLREKRVERGRKMLEGLNALLCPLGVHLDFDQDVLPASWADRGGSVTERHLCWAASLQLLETRGAGQELLSALSAIGVPLTEKAKAQLTDPLNPYLPYDLLGYLKSDLVPRFYVDADEELLSIGELIDLAAETGSIPVYPYLGDVTASVTGDKRAQTFEDPYLDELFPEIKRLGVLAVTYMPTRNTREQLRRVRELARKHALFEISGEDINTPRQSFLCRQLDDPFFGHLVEATWALIGHEKAASERLESGMFSAETLRKMPSLEERVSHFARSAQEG